MAKVLRRRGRASRRGKAGSGWQAAGLVLASGLLAQASVAERGLELAALNLAHAQTAQLHLTIPPPEDAATSDPLRPEACEAELSFVDLNGETYVDRDGQPVTRRVSVLPGQTWSLSLPASIALGDDLRRPGARALFRGIARLVSPPADGHADPCGCAQLSVEIHDTRTGRTTVSLEAPPDPFMTAPSSNP